MYCEYCGKENDKNNNYCVSCGKRLRIDNIQNKNKNISLIFGIICIIMSVLFNIVCFIPGIISIVYATKYKKESGQLGTGFGLSLGGMIFSLIILAFTILILLFSIMIITNISNDEIHNNNYEYVERV